MSIRLYVLFLFEYFRSHTSAAFFALVGISLGVGLFISTTANGIKAEKSLTDFAMGYFQGEYKIKISSALGEQDLPAELISRLHRDPDLGWVVKIVPRIQREVIVNDSIRAVYLGLDFLKETGNLSVSAESFQGLGMDTVFVSRALSERLNSEPTKIEADQKKFTIANWKRIETEGGNLFLEDIDSAMKRFGISGKVSFLLVQPDEFRVEQKSILETKLGPDYRVETIDDIREKSGNALRSFQLNLLVISFISLIIAFFMVSNTMSGLYLAREKELGILKTMGLGRGHTFLLFVSQSFLLGSAGSFFGLILGFYFSRLEFFSPEATTADLSYLKTYTSIPSEIWIVSMGIGIFGSVFSSAFSSWRAGKISPSTVLRESASGNARISDAKLLLYGVTSLILFCGVAYLPFRTQIPWAGLIGIGGIVVGIVLCFPWIFSAFGELFFRFSQISDRSFVFARIGLEETKNQPLRNTLTSATLMLATSLVVCLSILTDSYRRSLNDWVNEEFPADLTVINSSNLAAGINGGVPLFLLNEISKIETVRSLDGFCVNTRVETDKGNFTIHAYTFSTHDGENSPERNATGEKEILISSNMAYLQNFKVGDTIPISTPLGKKEFLIRGIKEHFFSERGTIMMDINRYEEYFGLQGYNSIKIFLNKGADLSLTKREIEEILEENPSLKILDAAEVRALYTEGVDKVFGVLNTLKTTAFLIAMISLISSLLHNLISKKTTLGILKYLGADFAQIRRILMTESVFITVISTCFGILLAFLLSPIVLYVVNKNAFGWTLKFTVSPEIVLFFLFLSPILGIISSVFPLYTLRKLGYKMSRE
ncbi:ABC transporter permease [Leptospira gomenensis]|uniref:ABC transporter permease n=1 Tax=Leptospira gomenensis TaxID=2484974 RepID=A0A5F1YGM0_9LEPT|nr:FtsX-like permease family protein [Leptospira gomenensis]TGK31492.1 ABC transporter permease [Leptospira gomenensis]TGK32482.1 ABC transporter permease [Leptospira gomenensis]TGK46197.1 ABC transporter permease [Leptospira gomenensis]TGK54722.1 ABC transporter permease [Leptospira gomenensis]